MGQPTGVSIDRWSLCSSAIVYTTELAHGPAYSGLYGRQVSGTYQVSGILI